MWLLRRLNSLTSDTAVILFLVVKVGIIDWVRVYRYFTRHSKEIGNPLPRLIWDGQYALSSDRYIDQSRRGGFNTKPISGRLYIVPIDGHLYVCMKLAEAYSPSWNRYHNYLWRVFGELPYTRNKTADEVGIIHTVTIGGKTHTLETLPDTDYNDQLGMVAYGFQKILDASTISQVSLLKDAFRQRFAILRAFL